MTDFLCERKCPLCFEGTERSPVVMASSPPAEDLPVEQLREAFIGLRPQQIFFTYHRCEVCGLLWNPVYFTDEALASLYAAMPANTAIAGDRDSARTQVGYAGLLSRVTDTRLCYLEIGCDEGVLASAATADAGADVHVTVIEPNREVHGRIRENVGQDVTIHETWTSVTTDVDFNRVAAVHVLDHLLAPRQCLSHVRRHAQANCEVVVLVHNEASVLRSLLGRRWPPFCLQHPQLFSKWTLADMLQREGFTVRRVVGTRNYISLRRAAGVAGTIGLPTRWLAACLPDLPVPVRLGNIAVISVPFVDSAAPADCWSME